jgi:hypothetical protein
VQTRPRRDKLNMRAFNGKAHAHASEMRQVVAYRSFRARSATKRSLGAATSREEAFVEHPFTQESLPRRTRWTALLPSHTLHR